MTDVTMRVEYAPVSTAMNADAVSAAVVITGPERLMNSPDQLRELIESRIEQARLRLYALLLYARREK